MTELATRWLGLELRSPLVVGASPLTDDLDALKACVDAGAGAVVMHSLFEEQLVEEQMWPLAGFLLQRGQGST